MRRVAVERSQGLHVLTLTCDGEGRKRTLMACRAIVRAEYAAVAMRAYADSHVDSHCDVMRRGAARWRWWLTSSDSGRDASAEVAAAAERIAMLLDLVRDAPAVPEAHCVAVMTEVHAALLHHSGLA